MREEAACFDVQNDTERELETQSQYWSLIDKNMIRKFDNDKRQITSVEKEKKN